MRASALLVLANRTAPLTGRSIRCTMPRKTAPGLPSRTRIISLTSSSRAGSPVGSGWTSSPERLFTTIRWLSSYNIRSGSNISGRLFMQRLRVCAKDGMFGFELAEGGGRSSRPYRFLYIRRNGSSVKNEPFVGRRGRIPFRFLQVRRDFRRRTRAVCVVLSARAGRKRRCLGCVVRSA